jgi:hypothetical protein
VDFHGRESEHCMVTFFKKNKEMSSTENAMVFHIGDYQVVM